MGDGGGGGGGGSSRRRWRKLIHGGGEGARSCTFHNHDAKGKEKPLFYFFIFFLGFIYVTIIMGEKGEFEVFMVIMDWTMDIGHWTKDCSSLLFAILEFYLNLEGGALFFQFPLLLLLLLLLLLFCIFERAAVSRYHFI